MRIDIISVQPDLLESPFQHSIMKRAQQKGLLEVVVHDLKEFGIGKHRQVDDYQFGGGAGMVLMVEPLANCIEQLQKERTYDEIIFLTPDGQRLEQKHSNKLSLHQNLMMICGHYKGIDERIREHYVTMEISIGDYVLSGGELAAAVLVDSIGRLIPGVLNDETSALFDSFQDNLLAPPVYTRPANYNGWEVPEILTSGNFPKIEEWRNEEALKRTQARRPELIKTRMNIELFRDYCLSKKAVEETFPFDEVTLVFKVMGEGFAITGLDGEEFRVNLKCDPDKAIMLREEHPDHILPGWHMNKKHWNTVRFESGLDTSLLKELTDHSYDLVVQKLTKKEKEILQSL